MAQLLLTQDLLWLQQAYLLNQLVDRLWLKLFLQQLFLSQPALQPAVRQVLLIVI